MQTSLKNLLQKWLEIDAAHGEAEDAFPPPVAFDQFCTKQEFRDALDNERREAAMRCKTIVEAAISEEREACAKLAAGSTSEDKDESYAYAYNHACENIAAAIRNRQQ
jgi:hypothetical protein